MAGPKFTLFHPSHWGDMRAWLKPVEAGLQLGPHSNMMKRYCIPVCSLPLMLTPQRLS